MALALMSTPELDAMAGPALGMLMVGVISFAVAALVSIATNKINMPVLIGMVTWTFGCGVVIVAALQYRTSAPEMLNNWMLVILGFGVIGLVCTTAWYRMFRKQMDQ